MPSQLPVPLKVFLKTLALRLATSPLVGYPLPFLPFQPKQNAYAILAVPPSLPVGSPQDLPIPPARLWAQYGPTPEDYLASGEHDANQMLALLATSGWTPEPGNQILELGCAAGRMLRWLAPLAATCSIWATDISATHVTWCQQYLGSLFTCFTGTTVPHLPFADNTFDCIYAGSVFTHIDDLADAWLLELRRVTRRDGRLYLTIHDRHTVDVLAQQRTIPLARHLDAHQAYRQWSRQPFGKMTIGRAYNSQVFYDVAYLRERTRTYLDILGVYPEAYSYQTAVIFRPR